MESVSADRRRIAALCRWFSRQARPLPWRTARRNPYHSLVSEFMLQQTQVSRVIEFYSRFIRRFPTVQSLAQASEQRVLEHWQGLGYYRRARMLRQAAKAIVRDHGGRVPRSIDSLRRLPGVGRYTAGAIASMVFGQAEAIVDGNVRRVLRRWGSPGLRSVLQNDRALDKWCWVRAMTLVQLAPRPAVFNEALMELGATICTPKNPRCGACPVRGMCASRAEPAVRMTVNGSSRTAARRAHEHHHALILTDTGRRIAVEQRPSTGMWAGMWQVPTIESTARNSPQQLCTRLAKTGIRLGRASLVRLGTFRHATTHKAITFHVYQAMVRGTTHRMADRALLKSLPMSNAQRKALALVKWSHVTK